MLEEVCCSEGAVDLETPDKPPKFSNSTSTRFPGSITVGVSSRATHFVLISWAMVHLDLRLQHLPSHFEDKFLGKALVDKFMKMSSICMCKSSNRVHIFAWRVPTLHVLVCCSVVITTCLQEMQTSWKMCPSYTTQNSLGLFPSSHRINCHKEWKKRVKSMLGTLLYIWMGKTARRTRVPGINFSLKKASKSSAGICFWTALKMRVYNDFEINFPKLYIILFMSSLRERSSRITFWVSQITWISSYVIRKLFCIKYKR